MEAVSVIQAKAESLELHFGMMLNGADGWCFPPILWTMVHPEILGTEWFKWSCGWKYTYLYTSVHTSGYVFRLTRLERTFFSVVCIQALGIRLWEQAWSYWAECISCFSSWFLRSDELQCWNRCWKCCIRQNFVSLFMMFCYDCLRFPAVLVMLAMVVPSLDLCLILLWCRHVCVSFSAVVMPLLWLSMSMSWVPQCGAPWCSGHLLHASLTASYRLKSNRWVNS